MSVRVRIPPLLRRLTGGREELEATGSTIAQVIHGLDGQWPGLAGKVLDERDELSRHLTVFVNGKDARLMDGAKTALQSGDLVSILGLMSGG